MKTLVRTVNPGAPEPEAIAEAAAILRAGGLVAFPTETVYGLGANALDPAAVARIFLAKGRPATNPVIVHVPDAASAQRLAASWPVEAERLAQRFWPGSLSLVLPKRPAVPDLVTAGGATVALRVPSHAVSQALLRAAGFPIAAPSANRSSELSPTRAEHVLRGLDGRIDLVLDGGPTPGGLESTVLDVTVTPARLLRPGLVGRAELQEVIGELSRLEPAESFQPLRSPGQLRRHYSARTPMALAVGPEVVRARAALGKRIGWLTIAGQEQEMPGVTVLALPADPIAYAAELYAALHTLDAAGLDEILVDSPPRTEAWAAIRDRLARAASKEI